MQCQVQRCEREAVYKADQLCQKHYFRQWRNGTTALRPPKPKHETPNGYIRAYAPNHPLADSRSYVFEHRKVAYDQRDGQIQFCERCGLVAIDWSNSHVDHIDQDRTNNEPSNLLVTCIGCNVMRSNKTPKHKYKGHTSLTCEGQTLTASEWSRDPRVRVSASTIRRRQMNGYSDYESIFAPKITHHSVKPKKQTTKFVDGERVSA